VQGAEGTITENTVPLDACSLKRQMSGDRGYEKVFCGRQGHVEEEE
jgi:hypothetical protein